MAYIMEESGGWHPGETAVHMLLNKGTRIQNPTAAGLSPSHAYRTAASPLIAFGALDRKGRPWTTIWGGERQFAGQIGPNLLGVQSLVDLDNDPVVDALFGGDGTKPPKGDGELLHPAAEAVEIMAGLSIDLDTRDRVKLAGNMAAGMVTAHDPGESQGEGAGDFGRVGKVQLAMLVKEALGNCPKYMNKKTIRPHIPHPQLLHASDTAPLPVTAIDLIGRADLFFLSSTNGKTMDTNHRGGRPGFMRVVTNDAVGSDEGTAGTTLIYPEYSGNQLYQTLGNLYVRPLVGVVIPDFETGTVLYLTGRATILIGADAAAYLPHTKLAVRIDVDRAILVADGLPFRGSVLDYSPYNPPLRRLVSEIIAAGGDSATASEKRNSVATAVLTGRQELSPSISRFSFTLKLPSDANPGADKTVQLWQAGQYARLDFSLELDVGWSHMRDEDPQSLNDDFIRTFTISSQPPLVSGGGVDTIMLEMTLRRHGPATNLLWRHDVRVPLEIPVLGYGGDRRFRIASEGCCDDSRSNSSSSSGGGIWKSPVFVAAGVGITPLLAQAPGILSSSLIGTAQQADLTVLWSLRIEDLPFAADSFSRIDGLARHTTLFVTSEANREDASSQEKYQEIIEILRENGAIVVEGRRIQKHDVQNAGRDNGEARRKFFVCTGPELLKDLQTWLVDDDMVWESFAF